MSTTISTKKKRKRSAQKTDEVLKVCPVCEGVWSDTSLMGERVYCFYPKGTLPTYGKKRIPCREHSGGA